VVYLVGMPQGSHLRSLGLRLALFLGLSSSAYAGVEDWQLSEIYQEQSAPGRRFVELSNLEGGCLFPSSTLDLYDAEGQLLSIIALTQTTTCFGAPTYLLLTTPASATFFEVGRDGPLLTSLPAAGQLCFASSQTTYDCVRWGAIGTAIVDLFGAGDESTASVSPDIALSRTATTHAVVVDWQERAPSPRQPNDGTVWIPPDAGPMPDAGQTADAGTPADAAIRVDSGPRPDAQGEIDRNDRYLDLDPVGGASCSCQSGGQEGGSLAAALLLLLFCRRRRRSRC